MVNRVHHVLGLMSMGDGSFGKTSGLLRPRLSTSLLLGSRAPPADGSDRGAKEALGTAVSFAPAAFDLHTHRRPPWFRREDDAHMLEALRKGGWQGDAVEAASALGRTPFAMST